MFVGNNRSAFADAFRGASASGGSLHFNTAAAALHRWESRGGSSAWSGAAPLPCSSAGGGGWVGGRGAVPFPLDFPG